MLFDNMIRDYARQDLKRLIPATHYLTRDHKPEADRELVDPILREPAMFQLTARERVAATALSDLATYEIRTRAIDNATMGHDDTSAPVEMTFDQVRERWGRREVFRRSALVYARMLNDQQLIEAYQQPLPAPDEPGAKSEPPTVPDPVAAERTHDDESWKAKAREKAHEIIRRQKAMDCYPSQMNLGDEIAREFREDGIMGAGGKPLTGAYIKRWALNGISSAQGRRLSTAIRRGK